MRDTLLGAAGWPWVVTSPGLPQIRTCAINASGSSRKWVHYVGLSDECMAIAGGRA